jgi:hypothetical protein
MSTFRAAFDWLVEAAKIIAALLAILTAVAFAFPWVENQINILTAARFGASGYVYYEINVESGEPTSRGQLLLLKPGNGLFSDIKVGDKLQTVSPKNFRVKSTTASRLQYELQQGDCVIVLSVDREEQVPEGITGGWLGVATAACGLFR